MKNLLKIILLFLTAVSATAQVNSIYFKVGDILSGSGAPNLVNAKVVLTDTTGDPRMVNGVLISPQVKTAYSKSDGKAYFTNVVYGNYNVRLATSPEASFDIAVSSTTTGTVDGATLRGSIFFPSPLESFYTKEQVDALFADFDGGVSFALLQSTSNSLQSQITSGGATTLVVTSIVNSVTGVITNTTPLAFKFSSAGTNDIASIAQPLVNAAYNTLAIASAALGTALTNDVNTTSNSLAGTSQTISTASTNALGLGSGFSAFVPTNRFATSNDLYGASNALQGQITSGGITAPVGTNIAVYISDLSSNLVYGNANTAINTSSNLSFAIERTQINTSSNLVYGNALSQINTTSNSIVGTDQASINTTSNTIVGHTVNISGTANQITSSAGPQTLGANPATTLSLPSTLILPGTLNVTGAQTNQNTLWVHGNQTNDASLYLPAFSGFMGGNLLMTTNQSLPVQSTVATNQYAIFTGENGLTNFNSTRDLQYGTNWVSHTHQGTTTNITATFNGTLQSFTVTNGPNVFIGFAGANGSVSYQIKSTNFTTLNFPYAITNWLAGSNSVMTNGVLSITSYGGTNQSQIWGAIKERQ